MERILKYTTIAFAIVVLCFGFSVIVGWQGHISSLIRYKHDTIAIVYNTGITFILAGTGIIFSVFNFKKTSLTLALIIFTIGVLSLLQHLLNINLGIDQLLFTHYDTLGNKYPGRMAPNTALCFIFSAVALLALNYNKFVKYCTVLAAGLGLLIFSLALVFLSGYLSDLEHAYAWGNITPMSTTAAIGFVLLSINLMLMASYKGVNNKIELLEFIPYGLTFCIFLATLLLVQKIGQQESLNNYSSNIPIITFIAGVLLAVFFGLFSYVSLAAKSTAKNAKQTASILRATLEATADGIIVVDLDGEIVIFNQQFIKLWDLPEAKMSNYNRQSLSKDLISRVVNKEHYLLQRKELNLHPNETQTDELKLKNGNFIARCIKPHIIDGKIVGRVCSYRNITDQKRLELQLEHQSTYDVLTNLPNRALMLELIARSIESSKKSNTNMGLVLIDIDKFSKINDSFGRSKGDALIKEIAGRLKQHLSLDNILGRIGGDEFMVIVNDLNKIEKSISVITRLMKAFDQPFSIYGHEVIVTGCIGVSFYPKDGHDADVLLSNADVAMLRAKKERRDNFQFYSQDMNDYTIQQIDLESQLHKAIDEEQFVVQYQPLYNLEQVECLGVEALVRWKHPERGMVAPLDFIPLAEELGLIQQIGEWVLKTACKQGKIWQDQGFTNIKIAVNISAHQFKFGMLSRTVKEILAETCMTPKNLEIELTESVLIDGSDDVSNTLRELASLGLSISIDDFGTGYSSFSYVRRFPVSKLKIDRAFITDMIVDADGRAIVKAMISMGKSLNMKVLAEGIETEQQLNLLKDMHCDQGQGFYFAKPMSAEDCTKFFKDHI